MEAAAGAVGFAVLAAVAMAADWWAVRTDRQRVETVAKPAVMVALCGVAATAEFEQSSVQPLILVALSLGLAGDVFLLPQVDRFIAGLVAFLVGHLVYIAAFVLLWSPTPWIAIGLAGLAALVGVFGRPIERAIRDSRLRLPVLAYIAVTGAVIVSGSATGHWLIVGGSLAFALSDGLLGSNRFVTPAPQRRVWIHVLYHLGQAAIVAGAIQA